MCDTSQNVYMCGVPIIAIWMPGYIPLSKLDRLLHFRYIDIYIYRLVYRDPPVTVRVMWALESRQDRELCSHSSSLKGISPVVYKVIMGTSHIQSFCEMSTPFLY